MALGNTTSARSTKFFTATNIIYSVIVLVVMVFIFFWATVIFGHVHGTEFSAETLSRREFQYYQLPLFGIQVTPLDRTVVAAPTEQFLISNKYITPIRPEQWDLIRGYEGVWPVDPLGASILCTYFDAVNQKSQPIWVAWTKDHPQLAAILWPEVIAVARSRHYAMIPDMMQLVQVADEKQPQKFQSELGALMADQAVRLAKWSESVDANRARDLYKLALSKVPQHPAAQKGLESLGQAKN